MSSSRASCSSAQTWSRLRSHFLHCFFTAPLIPPSHLIVSFLPHNSFSLLAAPVTACYFPPTPPKHFSARPTRLQQHRQNDTLLQSGTFPIRLNGTIVQRTSCSKPMAVPFVRCSRTWQRQKNSYAYLASSTGLRPLGDGDAHLPRPDRPSAVHLAPRPVQVHLREPHHSETTIWHEGMTHHNNCTGFV